MAWIRRVAIPAGLLGFLALFGCSEQPPTAAPDDGAAAKLTVSANRAAGVADRGAATHFDAEVPLAWFDLAYKLVRAERLTPPVASRAFGYAGVGLYEALVAGMPEYQSLAGRLNGLGPMPTPAGRGYHWPTVANAALATVLRGLFADASPPSLEAIATLEKDFAERFAALLVGEAFARSTAHGQQVGQAILAWSRADGYVSLHNCAFTPPAGRPELWVSTPPAHAAALEPCWGQMRPFVLAGGRTCDPGPPPAYSEDPASPFYREAKETHEVLANLTQEERTIALYWADNPGETGTPPGHSVSILGQILRQRNASLALAAEAYARVGMAVADAFISCWWSKYEYNLLRPVTYIRRVIDPAWTPLIATPPFPEYTSGHSVQSGASAQVLTDLFGSVAFVDRTHEAAGFAPRAFPSFFAAADEAAISRLYGGIHYRAAIERGVDQGKCIGNQVSALPFRRW